MEINNEEHAREMIGVLKEMPLQVQRRDLDLAIQKLELSFMYYEQKGNEQGASRTERCIQLLKGRLADLDE